MARKRSRAKRNLGSSIRIRKLDGLGKITQPGSLVGAAMPPMLGAGTSVITTMGIRQAKGAPAALVEYSPWVGLGASTLVAAIVYNMQSRPAGVATFVGGLCGTLSIVMSEYLAKMQLFGTGTAGFGAIVPEYAGMSGLGDGGMGAIVMEPHASRGYGAGPIGGMYGETISLSGINTAAMGTQQFQV